ncbi:hypothetical protein SLE2022_373380 [Rubroshorea leprosula]
MEALNFLMFWRPTYCPQKKTQNREIPNPSMESEEGDDSFFDLELSMDDHVYPDSGEGKPVKSVGGNELISFLRPTLSLSPGDHFSKRKVMPIEPCSKPQSPIALLKSSPKFRVFTLRKSTKSMATMEKSEKTELTRVLKETLKHEKQGSTNLPIFSRGNSLRKTEGISQKQKTEELFRDDSSKRFSKDVIQKYLNRFKVSKTQTDKLKFCSDITMPSPASSPAAVHSSREKQGNMPAGILGVYKHLGKSRSASATASPVSRRDDSLLLQHDGIQSAILHCKKSFNSSREAASFFSSDSSLEKLSNASSTDSSMLSRNSSDSAFEKLG